MRKYVICIFSSLCLSGFGILMADGLFDRVGDVHYMPGTNYFADTGLKGDNLWQPDRLFLQELLDRAETYINTGPDMHDNPYLDEVHEFPASVWLVESGEDEEDDDLTWTDSEAEINLPLNITAFDNLKNASRDGLAHLQDHFDASWMDLSDVIDDSYFYYLFSDHFEAREHNEKMSQDHLSEKSNSDANFDEILNNYEHLRVSETSLNAVPERIYENTDEIFHDDEGYYGHNNEISINETGVDELGEGWTNELASGGMSVNEIQYDDQEAKDIPSMDENFEILENQNETNLKRAPLIPNVDADIDNDVETVFEADPYLAIQNIQVPEMSYVEFKIPQTYDEDEGYIDLVEHKF